MRNTTDTIVSIQVTDNRFNNLADRLVNFRLGATPSEFDVGDFDFFGKTADEAMASAIEWHEANPPHKNEMRELWVCKRVQFDSVKNGDALK